MMRTVHGDEARFRKSYWGALPHADGKPIYFAGDGAHRDGDGYFWIMGRVDDVINVSGHRLGTMEIESALVSHPAVAEAAVVGRPDELKGSAVAAFVTLEAGRQGDDALIQALRQHVAHEIGPIAKPDEHLLHRRAAQNPQRQNHAPHSAVPGQWANHHGGHSTLEDATVLERLRGGCRLGSFP